MAKGNSGLAGAGAIVRDARGVWVSSQMVNLGVTTSVMAKVWCAFTALNMAWDLGCRQVI